MFATQRPLSLAALTENATAAGWKTKPSWFLVSEHDNAIPPDAERFMAERMGAATESIRRIAHGVHRQPGAGGRLHQEGARRLTAHRDPDGDAMGSEQVLDVAVRRHVFDSEVLGLLRQVTGTT